MTDDCDDLNRSVDSFTESLLARARQGDGAAWRRLEQAYRRLVFWWCAKGRVPASDIDDVAQETFAALAKSLGRFQRGSFRSFLWGIARHKIQDYWRSRQERLPMAEGEVDQLLAGVEEESHSDSGRATQATKLVFDAIVETVRGEFSEQDWQAFWRFAVDGRTASDVATELGISRNQVYLSKSRILRRIRAEFGDRPAVESV